MATEAQRRAIKKYNEKNTRFYGIRLNYNNDADMIEYLDRQDSVQGTIKAAVQEYMEREEKM